MHALSLTSGAEKFGGPVLINPTVQGTGFGSNNGVISIEQGCYARPGLALLNGVIYVTLGHCSHGWVIGYSAGTLAQVSVFNSSPNGKGASIWMSGGAPAIDSSGNLYVETGTDTDSTPDSGYQNSFVKLSSSLSALDFFEPSNSGFLLTNDADLGSGSPIVMPDNSSGHPHELIGAGKDGRIFVLDRDNLGQFTSMDLAIQEVQSGVQQFDNFFDTPAYWNGNLYYHAENDVLRQFSWSTSTGLLSNSPTHVAQTAPFATHGATPVVSANGSTNGIVWDVDSGAQPNGPAVLHAYDATNVSNELYNTKAELRFLYPISTVSEPSDSVVSGDGLQGFGDGPI